MHSAKQLRKMTKFHFLDQNLNLPPPPYNLQTQLFRLLCTNFTSQSSFNHIDFSLTTLSFVSLLVSFKWLDFPVMTCGPIKYCKSSLKHNQFSFNFLMLTGDLYPHPRHIDIPPSMQSGGLGVAIRLAFHPKPALQGWTRAGSQLVLASNITIARIPQTLFTFGRLYLLEAHDTGDNIMFINGILQYHDDGIPTRNRYLTFKQSFFGLVPVTL